MEVNPYSKYLESVMNYLLVVWEITITMKFLIWSKHYKLGQKAQNREKNFINVDKFDLVALTYEKDATIVIGKDWLT